MTRPLLLDLFCGAGGAAMGYHRAGFDVVGVDIAPQPRYPFEFIQADAIEVLTPRLGRVLIAGYHMAEFDAFHASPPCQAYSVLAAAHRNSGTIYPDLVDRTRDLLIERTERNGRPYVIENVPGAPVRPDLVLCGSMFGMRVRRHRWFECSWGVSPMTWCCDHSRRPVVVSGNNHSGGHTATEIKEAMEMPWAATRYEVRQAIPPAYTEFIGAQLLQHVRAVA